MTRLVVGTRGSDLALWQARHVAARLAEARPGLELEERIIATGGDRDKSAPIDTLGGSGVFVRELEQALLEGRVDLAVHSMKDLPTTQPDGLVICAVPERHDPRDVLLSVEGWSFEQIPRGATVATGSYRRRCQLLHARPDLRMVQVRGNVPTRVRKLLDRRFDVLVLAKAGIERLGIRTVPAVPIPTATCLPAVGQAALALETRAGDEAAIGCALALNDPETFQAVAVERSFLRRLGGGCLAPATGYAVVKNGRVELKGVVGDPAGTRLLSDQESGQAEHGERVGETLAERMLSAGAGELLRLSREQTARDES